MDQIKLSACRTYFIWYTFDSAKHGQFENAMHFRTCTVNDIMNSNEFIKKFLTKLRMCKNTHKIDDIIILSNMNKQGNSPDCNVCCNFRSSKNGEFVIIIYMISDTTRKDRIL